MSAALPHELRTPLAAIQGYAEVLCTDWDALSASDGRAMLDEILSATDRLKRLVENYALYVELESHPGDEAAGNEAGPTSASVIQEAASEHASMYQRERVGDVVCDVLAAALAIQKRHLKRLVIELVDNALKFSAPGETVQVRGSRDDGRYYLEVVDCGRGMDAEQVNRLGAFVQFDRSEYEQQGVGLGLALVHRIVKRSAGAVHINSEEGAGTMVRVALPIESRDSAVPGRTSTSNRRSV
jgi:signal transduction histidine kinase